MGDVMGEAMGDAIGDVEGIILGLGLGRVSALLVQLDSTASARVREPRKNHTFFNAVRLLAAIVCKTRKAY